MSIKLKNVQFIKEMIARSGYSIRDFGEAVGISKPYVVQIVNGQRNPSPKVAKSIIDNLGCQFDDIFFIENDSKRNQEVTEVR